MTPVGTSFGFSAVLVPHRVHALFRLPAEHDSLGVAVVLLELVPCGCLDRARGFRFDLSGRLPATD